MTLMRTITPRDLYELHKSGRQIDLIDVRTPAEFNSVHAQGAKLVPLGELSPEKVRAVRSGSDGDPLYVICRSGARSQSACRKLEAAGLTNVVDVEGGTSAWERAGLPVVRGTPILAMTPALRRLGLLVVFASLVLSWFFNPWFSIVALAAWIGMIVLGRGQCPLGTCSLPSEHRP